MDRIKIHNRFISKQATSLDLQASNPITIASIEPSQLQTFGILKANRKFSKNKFKREKSFVAYYKIIIKSDET